MPVQMILSTTDKADQKIAKYQKKWKLSKVMTVIKMIEEYQE